VLGPQPAFAVPEHALIGSHPPTLAALLLFALLGAIIGIAATVFVWALPFAEGCRRDLCWNWVTRSPAF